MNRLARVILPMLLLACAACAPATQEPPMTEAEALAEKMADAMGGREAFENTRYLRFDWTVVVDGKETRRMPHLWDCHTGRYRVEWTTREGERVQALFNINTREGRVWKDGAEVTADEDAKKLLESAYGRFINDSYWLLMPWKLRDPGVNLHYMGEKEVEGTMYKVLHVSFGDVGLTPGDQYWAFINPETMMMERWAYFLQDFEGEPSMDGARPFAWKKWETVGHIKLAREKVSMMPDSDAMIHFPVLAAYEQVDEKLFEDPAMPMPGEEGN